MKSHDTGPRRSQAIDAHLRRTRLLAVVALLALTGAIASDVLAGSFWVRHAPLASLAASVIVVMLTVAVINEVLELRRQRRWTVLAQYVMLELVRNARLIWTGVLEHARLGRGSARVRRRQRSPRSRHRASHSHPLGGRSGRCPPSSVARGDRSPRRSH
jgi:hypothetical protein